MCTDLKNVPRLISKANGDATQHLQYLPFGEDLVHEQNTAAYLSPYTFSGKERDVETNLSYFGARYYESSLSVWLSVDPMSDKYPSLSAYNYCALNPVMLVDPDGREVEGDPNSNSKIQVTQTFKFDKTPTGNDKKVGTDLLTQTEVSTSVNNGVETRTTVVTSVSVDADGKPAKNATRFAFSESGTGDNRQFAQTPVEEVPLEKVKGPIVDAVKATAKYKAQNGESQLQTKASRLNSSTAIIVGTASSYVPLGKGISKFIQAVAIGAGTAQLQPFNPEALNITY